MNERDMFQPKRIAVFGGFDLKVLDLEIKIEERDIVIKPLRPGTCQRYSLMEAQRQLSKDVKVNPELPPSCWRC